MTLHDLLIRLKRCFCCPECNKRPGTNPDCETCRKFEADRQTYSM